MSVTSPYAAAVSKIPSSTSKVEILGSSTSYWSYGKEVADWTIVAVHGYRGEHHGIEPVIAQLPEYRFIVPDLPGFGESTPMTEVGHSIAGYEAWLEALLAKLNLTGRAIIFGHSFGTIVTSAAIAKGLRTPGLILMNPIAISGTEGPRKFATWITVSFYRTAAKLPERLAKTMLGNWLVVQFMSVSLAKTKDRELRKWIHEEHHRYFNNFSDSKSVGEAFEASVSQNVGQVAEQISTPTLLIAAELDDITPISAVRELASRIPDSELEVIPRVGHLIHYEKPKLAADAIRSFLNRLGKN